MIHAAPPSLERALRLPFAALAAALLLHADLMPAWCNLTALLALAWRIGAGQRRWRLPPAWLRTAMLFVLVALVVPLFRSIGGLAAGSALLLTMASLKLFETRTARDGRILVGAALFLLVAACLDRQGLARLPLYAGSLCLAVAALYALGSSATADAPRLALHRAARDLLVALPFAVACFLLFPRFATPLWGAPEGARGITGLSDEMSPGSITELATSDEIAFRVRFGSSAPSPRQRYWRGPVLHDFDGFTWRRGRFPPFPPAPRDVAGAAFTQDITVEPNGQGYAFALDAPESVRPSPGTRILLDNDRQLRLFRPPSQPVKYRAVTMREVRDATPLPGWLRRADLRLPESGNPRSAELALRIRASSPRDEDFAAAVLAYFRNAGFRYSLSPPPLQRDSVDDLIFRTREGFCGHFASAYTVLMRAGGVPARVVTGYLGGEWNGYGGYFTVRQAEAHAWSEIWLEGRGWTRIDPTSVVQPARLEESLRSLLPDESLGGSLFNAPWTRAVLDYWDAGNQWWQSRVVGFSQQSQRSLLDRIGLPDADFRLLASLCAALTALWLGAIAWRLRRAVNRPSDPLARSWAGLKDALQGAGVSGLQESGPLDLARRVGETWPDLEPVIRRLAGDYAKLRYGPPDASSKTLSQDLQRGIRQLLPRIRSLRPRGPSVRVPNPYPGPARAGTRPR